MSSRHGWYYECGSVQDDDVDVWALIGRAVPEAADDGRLHALMVGKMVQCEVELDEDDVVSMCDGMVLTPDRVAELVSERHGDRVYEGRAILDAAAKRAFANIVRKHRCAEDAAAEIVCWARDHIELDPAIACLGRHPLPIEYVEGEWIFGGSESESPAVITYAEDPSPETGHVGWVWWALGKMGDAPSLAEAMKAAMAVLDQLLGPAHP